MEILTWTGPAVVLVVGRACDVDDTTLSYDVRRLDHTVQEQVRQEEGTWQRNKQYNNNHGFLRKYSSTFFCIKI